MDQIVSMYTQCAIEGLTYDPAQESAADFVRSLPKKALGAIMGIIKAIGNAIMKLVNAIRLKIRKKGMARSSYGALVKARPHVTAAVSKTLEAAHILIADIQHQFLRISKIVDKKNWSKNQKTYDQVNNDYMGAQTNLDKIKDLEAEVKDSVDAATKALEEVEADDNGPIVTDPSKLEDLEKWAEVMAKKAKLIQANAIEAANKLAKFGANEMSAWYGSNMTNMSRWLTQASTATSRMGSSCVALLNKVDKAMTAGSLSSSKE